MTRHENNHSFIHSFPDTDEEFEGHPIVPVDRRRSKRARRSAVCYRQPDPESGEDSSDRGDDGEWMPSEHGPGPRARRLSGKNSLLCEIK